MGPHGGIVLLDGEMDRDLHDRVKRHRAEKVKIFDSITLIECGSETMDSLEAAYINKLKPEYNVDIPRDHGGIIAGIEETSFCRDLVKYCRERRKSMGE